MKKAALISFSSILIVLLAVGLLVVPKSDSRKSGMAAADKFNADQKILLEQHNDRRIAHGVEPLELSGPLCSYAQKHAEQMAGGAGLVHSSMSKLQESCGGEVVGENIAWGQETPESVVSSWMWSPMHRWNILGSSYRKAGFGVKEDPKGRKYWCAVFSN